VYDDIQWLVKESLEVKVDCLLMKGFNDNGIIEFIELTKTQPLQIGFIQFIPFDGNK